MNLKIKYEKGFIKPDKNSLILLGIALLSAILAGYAFFYYLKKEPEIIIQPSSEEGQLGKVIKSLTAPVGEISPVSKEIEQNLSASSGSNGAESTSEESEDVIKSLTAPE